MERGQKVAGRRVGAGGRNAGPGGSEAGGRGGSGVMELEFWRGPAGWRVEGGWARRAEGM